MALIRCPKCNIETSDEHEFCPYCKTRLKPLPKEETAPTETETVKKRKPMSKENKKTLIAVGAIVGVILAAIIGFRIFVFVRLLQANAMIENYQFQQAKDAVANLDARSQDKVVAGINKKVEKEIVGVWGYYIDESQYMLFSFGEDSSLKMVSYYDGQGSAITGAYKVSSSNITLMINENAGVYTYQMADNVLVLTNDSGDMALSKLDDSVITDEMLTGEQP